MGTVIGTVIFALSVYLLTGLGVLFVFDAVTGRIRSRTKDASIDVQTKMLTGSKVSIVITLLATWMFWPLVIYSAVESRLRSKDKDETE